MQYPLRSTDWVVPTITTAAEAVTVIAGTAAIGAVVTIIIDV